MDDYSNEEETEKWIEDTVSDRKIKKAKSRREKRKERERRRRKDE
jgi:hypothetical protein